MERFKVIDKSVSAHCCFSATVIDTDRVDGLGNGESVCECFDQDAAELIAAALNAAAHHDAMKKYDAQECSGTAHLSAAGHDAIRA